MKKKLIDCFLWESALLYCIYLEKVLLMGASSSLSFLFRERKTEL